MTTTSDRQEKHPASDEVTEVAPGILRLQLPISMPGLGHVNCYALEDHRGFTVVDPGLPDPDSFTALETRLRSVGGDARHIHTVVITHSHPDHFGGAGRLRILNDTEIVAHRDFRTIFDLGTDDTVELLDARAPKVDPDGFDPAELGRYLLEDGDIPDVPARFAPWGGEIPFPGKDAILAMRAWDDLTKRGFVSPQPTRRLDEADTVRLGRRDWIAVHTPGHTGDHLCLWDPESGVLLSGDHVLPTITPHISGLSSSEDSLADYMANLDKVSALEGVELVLPAHGGPFTDLPARVDDIKRHHQERLELLREIASQLGEADVIEFSHHLFQERSWGAMAESETYAHLEHLRILGEASHRHDGRMLRYRLLDA